MKRLLIVNNNMKVGGVQKSLYNLLWSLCGRYEISLYLFSNTGEYANKLPSEVKLLEDHSLFSYLGRSQAECKSLPARLTRGLLAALTRVLGRHTVMKLLFLSKKTLKEDYDCAIAFLHNGNPHNFYGGVQDFVLRRVRAKKKIAFLHCDYATCGANEKHNNRLLEGFDAIAACSEGCRDALTATLPHLGTRCAVVRNCHRFEEIRALSLQNTVIYEAGFVHLLMVCRMAHEKGVDRAIRAVGAALQQGFRVKLHLVGDGAMLDSLKALCGELELSGAVTFYGEQTNPYAFMPNADLFLLTSYHEAAPMVIEEAACLGLPVLTVRTTSSGEMVERQGRGWACENSQQALETALLYLLARPQRLSEAKTGLRDHLPDNQRAMEDFISLIENRRG